MCGKSACTVRREGGLNSPPYPYYNVLIGMVFDYLESESPFRLKDTEYEIPKAA